MNGSDSGLVCSCECDCVASVPDFELCADCWEGEHTWNGLADPPALPGDGTDDDVFAEGRP